VGARLQLFLRNFLGCAVLFLILFGPGIVIAYLSRSLIWVIASPITIIVILILLLKVTKGFNPNYGKRNVTPEQFANALERHLLGTEGKWDWDDITSICVTDDRLERIRQGLSRFDRLESEKDREDFKALIAAIRRGDFPEVVLPEFLTYR
jgi:hypothetical protein